ncbi:MAG: hypothetical protein NZM26_05255, partial [Patescibacteria group bacterium]|nr:hypothetical protein [Patescibacteria group bacterium]
MWYSKVKEKLFLYSQKLIDEKKTAKILYCLMVLAIIVYFYLLRFAEFFGDEAVNIYAGYLISKGYRLYSDIFNHHLLLDYIPPWFVSLFQKELHYELTRVILITAIYIISSLSFLLNSALSSASHRLFAASLFLAFILGHTNGNFYSHHFLVDHLIAMAVVLLLNAAIIPTYFSLENHGPNIWQLAVAGSACGILATASLGNVFVCAVWAPYLLYMLLKPYFRWLYLLTFGLSFLGVIIIQFLWLVQFGALQGFWEQSVLFNQLYYSRYGAAWQWALKDGFLGTQNLSENPRLLVVIFVTALFLVYSLMRKGLKIFPALSLLIFVVLTTMAFKVRGLRGGHASPVYFFTFTLVAFTLLKYMELNIAIFLKKPKAYSLIACAVLFLSSGSVIFIKSLTGDPWAKRFDPEEGVIYIRQNSQKQDKIQAIYDPFPYILTGRELACPTLFYLPWNATWDRERNGNAFLKCLQEKRPRFIFYDPEGNIW